CLPTIVPALSVTISPQPIESGGVSVPASATWHPIERSPEAPESQGRIAASLSGREAAAGRLPCRAAQAERSEAETFCRSVRGRVERGARIAGRRPRRTHRARRAGFVGGEFLESTVLRHRLADPPCREHGSDLASVAAFQTRRLSIGS